MVRSVHLPGSSLLFLAYAMEKSELNTEMKKSFQIPLLILFFSV